MKLCLCLRDEVKESLGSADLCGIDLNSVGGGKGRMRTPGEREFVRAGGKNKGYCVQNLEGGSWVVAMKSLARTL